MVVYLCLILFIKSSKNKKTDISQKTVLLTSLKKEVEGCSPNGLFDTQKKLNVGLIHFNLSTGST